MTGHAEPPQTDDQEPVAGCVTLRTQPDLHGTYRVALEVTDDVAAFLTPAAALEHASYVLAAVAAAEYDARVFRQLTDMAMDTDTTARLLQHLRSSRTLPAPAAPLHLRPGVTGDGSPFLNLSLPDGQQLGQWTLDDARRHAAATIEASHATEYDSDYLCMLTGFLGLNDGQARQVIAALGCTHSHRPKPDAG